MSNSPELALEKAFGSVMHNFFYECRDIYDNLVEIVNMKTRNLQCHVYGTCFGVCGVLLSSHRLSPWYQSVVLRRAGCI
jgi:hypothetical protein